MNECYNCGFWDSDYEGCACPPEEKWFACPLEPEPTDEEWKNYVHGDEQDEQENDYFLLLIFLFPFVIAYFFIFIFD